MSAERLVEVYAVVVVERASEEENSILLNTETIHVYRSHDDAAAHVRRLRRHGEIGALTSRITAEVMVANVAESVAAKLDAEGVTA